MKKLSALPVILTVTHFVFVALHYFGVVTCALKYIGQPGIWVADKMGWYGWSSASGTLETVSAFVKGGSRPEWPLSFWLCMLATSILWGVVAALVIRGVLKKI